MCSGAFSCRARRALTYAHRANLRRRSVQLSYNLRALETPQRLAGFEPATFAFSYAPSGKTGSHSWIRTTVLGAKTRCPAARRSGNGTGSGNRTLAFGFGDRRPTTRPIRWMAAAVGVEPTTLRFEAERSIQLSYAAECLRLPPTLLEKSAHGQNP
jgi:hypothetical protein